MKASLELKTSLERIFPGNKAKQEGSITKLHVDLIKTDQLINLASLPEDYRIEIEMKRSGTGITILVTE